MLFRFDIVLYANAQELEQAIKAHPTEYGWQLCPGQWKRITERDVITAALFYGLVPAMYISTKEKLEQDSKKL